MHTRLFFFWISFLKDDCLILLGNYKGPERNPKIVLYNEVLKSIKLWQLFRKAKARGAERCN